MLSMAPEPGALNDPEQLDFLVRTAAFEFLTQQKQLFGEVVPRRVLEKGFVFAERRVPLVGPQGIFKPAILPEIPISITTVPVIEGSPRPYNDEVSLDGLLLYRYRGQDPQHPENRGLRKAMEQKIPLVYLYGVVPGQYMPVWPIYIVGDNPRTLTFTVAMDDAKLPAMHSQVVDDPINARRQYITVTTRQRLHQRSFRERVLKAYREQCAICRLRHEQLLEAAHILPDNHPQGEPTTSNGIALCKIHHAAYDCHILGIRPDLVVELRTDILKEIDGPMLKYGLQEFHGASLSIPRKMELRPNPKFLEERYAMFRAA
jgi:putative restriction endonuclease